MKYRIACNPVPELANLGPESAPVHLLYGAVTVVNNIAEWNTDGALRFMSDDDNDDNKNNDNNNYNNNNDTKNNNNNNFNNT